MRDQWLRKMVEGVVIVGEGEGEGEDEGGERVDDCEEERWLDRGKTY